MASAQEFGMRETGNDFSPAASVGIVDMNHSQRCHLAHGARFPVSPNRPRGTPRRTVFRPRHPERTGAGARL